MSNMSVLNTLYDRLPAQPETVNRYDRSWDLAEGVRFRFYVSPKTNGKASWSWTLMSPRWHVSVDLGRKLYEEIYVGTERPYQGNDRSYWKVYKGLYFKRRDKHGWRRWRVGYLNGMWRDFGFRWWKMSYYDGFRSFHITKRGTDWR